MGLLVALKRKTLKNSSRGNSHTDWTVYELYCGRCMHVDNVEQQMNGTSCKIISRATSRLACERIVAAGICFVLN